MEDLRRSDVWLLFWAKLYTASLWWIFTAVEVFTWYKLECKCFCREVETSWWKIQGRSEKNLSLTNTYSTQFDSNSKAVNTSDIASGWGLHFFVKTWNALTLRGHGPRTRCSPCPGWWSAHPTPRSHSSNRKSLPGQDGWSGMPTPAQRWPWSQRQTKWWNTSYIYSTHPASVSL